MLPDQRKKIFHLSEIRDLTSPFVLADGPSSPHPPLVLLARVMAVLFFTPFLFKLSVFDFTALFALAVLLSLLATILFLSYLFDVRNSMDKYRFLNESLEVETGFLSKEIRLLSWAEVTSVRTRSSALQRLYGTGDVILQLSQSTGSTVEMGATLAVWNAGSISQRKTSGETLILRDVKNPVEKAGFVRKLMASARQPDKDNE